MNIEHELQRSLRRQPAPPDLADRVMARIDPPATVAPAGRRTPVRRWLAAAAAAVLVATGAARYYSYQQSAAEVERANQDIRLALQITSAKLALVQARVEASLANEQR